MAKAKWAWAILLCTVPATVLWFMAIQVGGDPYGSITPLVVLLLLIGGILIINASFRQDVLLGFLVFNTTLLNFRAREEDTDLVMGNPSHPGPVNWQKAPLMTMGRIQYWRGSAELNDAHERYFQEAVRGDTLLSDISSVAMSRVPERVSFPNGKLYVLGTFALIIVLNGLMLLPRLRKMIYGG
jgi:hypothetical protein